MKTPSIQLFCIPFAGGSSRSFDGLAAFLDEFIEFIPISYPGRGRRAREEYFTSYNELVADVTEQIERRRNEEIPYAVLGYSMGAAVAYDFIQNEPKSAPVHAFMCAREAICFNPKSKGYAGLSKSEFTERVKALGGIDERILGNPRFLDIYLRPIYADYKLWSMHEYRKDKGNIKTDITAFFSSLDTPFDKVKAWEGLTDGGFDCYEFGTNHFFLFEYAKELGDIISRILRTKTENKKQSGA